MKKVLLYTLLLVGVLSSCRKQDEPTLGNPDERLSTLLAQYQTQLTSAPFGWKAFLMPDGGGLYSFYIDFNESNRVTMLSDIDASSSTEPYESSYRLKALQRPTLLFDTYSYIHLLADPNPNILGGETGAGYYSDFEFSFISSGTDTIRLEGNFSKSKLMLVRAKTAVEAQSFIENSNTAINNFSKLRTYFKRLTVGGTSYEVNIDPSTKTIIFNYYVNGTLTTHTSLFYIDGGVMYLVTPLKQGSTTISTFSGLTYDATGFVSASINGENVKFAEATAPLQYDVNAARTFYNNPPNGFYWISDYGFTVDGVVDAYGVTTIPNYSFILFYPKYNTAYSRLGFIVGGGYAAYGPAPIAQFLPDGRVYFTSAGAFGTAPAAIRPIITNTTNRWMDPDGFYVIKINTNTYDLVSAKDARAWIRFSN